MYGVRREYDDYEQVGCVNVDTVHVDCRTCMAWASWLWTCMVWACMLWTCMFWACMLWTWYGIFCFFWQNRDFPSYTIIRHLHDFMCLPIFPHSRLIRTTRLLGSLEYAELSNLRKRRIWLCLTFVFDMDPDSWFQNPEGLWVEYRRGMATQNAFTSAHFYFSRKNSGYTIHYICRRCQCYK